MIGSSAKQEQHAEPAVPLFVDLDGTLVKTDLLLESLLSLLKSSLHRVFMLPIWLLRGKAYFKSKIAAGGRVDPSKLPYHEQFLSFLRNQHARGRKLVLASASNARIVETVAAHLGIFSAHIGSDTENNLAGVAKLAAIKKLVGDAPFDYAANDRVDLPIWKEARKAIAVCPSPALVRHLQRSVELELVFPRAKGGVKAFIRAIRCHQWLKNLLVFVPLAMAHRLTEPALTAQAVLAFFAFSFAASAAYIANDLLDLENDRGHAEKKRRPFASGDLPLITGFIAAPALLVLGASLAFFLPAEFQLLLGLYVIVTMAYSTRLKRLIVMDVLTLAGLYTLRIIAGGAAVAVEPSFWLMGFSMFLFLSLALVKRYSELMRINALGGTSSSGRGYRVGDLSVLGQLGASSSMMAVLVLALYINSENVVQLYSRPQAIWLLCPVMLYWVCRIWLLTTRGKMDEDPVVFAAKDGRTYLLGLVTAVILWVAA